MGGAVAGTVGDAAAGGDGSGVSGAAVTGGSVTAVAVGVIAAADGAAGDGGAEIVGEPVGAGDTEPDLAEPMGDEAGASEQLATTSTRRTASTPVLSVRGTPSPPLPEASKRRMPSNDLNTCSTPPGAPTGRFARRSVTPSGRRY